MALQFNEAVYAAVRNIPYGRVAAYGTIAKCVGHPRGARQVGRALHFNPDPEHTPCYRVVFADGSLSPAFAFGGENAQRALLEREGVKFTEDGKVKREFFV